MRLQGKKIGQAMLQIAAIVFFLNATMAYGACCPPMAVPDDDAVMQGMPCHHDDEVGESDSSSPECCLMCVPFMAAPTLDGVAILPSEGYILTSLAIVTPRGFDPPFRPPIIHLS